MEEIVQGAARSLEFIHFSNTRWLEGTRAIDGDSTRRAAFVHLEQGSYWGLMEFAKGVGMLESGRTTPFATGDVVISPTGRGWATPLNSNPTRTKMST